MRLAHGEVRIRTQGLAPEVMPLSPPPHLKQQGPQHRGSRVSPPHLGLLKSFAWKAAPSVLGFSPSLVVPSLSALEPSQFRTSSPAVAQPPVPRASSSPTYVRHTCMAHPRLCRPRGPACPDWAQLAARKTASVPGLLETASHSWSLPPELLQSQVTESQVALRADNVYWLT